MSYQLVRQLQQEAIPVQHSCRVLCVSRSGYYAARHRSAKPVLCKTSIHLKAAFMASHQSYGSRPIKMERVWQRQYANHAEAKADITDYIVGSTTASD